MNAFFNNLLFIFNGPQLLQAVGILPGPPLNFIVQLVWVPLLVFFLVVLVKNAYKILMDLLKMTIQILMVLLKMTIQILTVPIKTTCEILMQLLDGTSLILNVLSKMILQISTALLRMPFQILMALNEMCFRIWMVIFGNLPLTVTIAACILSYYAYNNQDWWSVRITDLKY